MRRAPPPPPNNFGFSGILNTVGRGGAGGRAARVRVEG